MHFLDLTQGSSEWLEVRRNYIMASDAPVIMGVSKYRKTLKDLWKEKLGETQDWSTSNCDYGLQQESKAREEYTKITGIETQPVVIIKDKDSFLGASLDGLNSHCDRAIEIKTTNKWNHELAKENKIPEEFYPQLQHQLYVLNHDEMDYLSWFQKELKIVTVKKDPNYIEKMLEKEELFWECVESFIEPLEEKISIPEERIMAFLEAQEKKKELEHFLKEEQEFLLKHFNYEAFEGNQFSLIKKERKGNVDYSLIPELKNVNLENYRKKNSCYFTFVKK